MIYRIKNLLYIYSHSGDDQEGILGDDQERGVGKNRGLQY